MDNSSTDSSSSSSSSSDSVTLRLIGAFSYLIWSIIGIFVNAVLFIVFLKGHKQFKTMSFFIISWQLLVVNFLSLFIQIFLVVPINIAGKQIYPQIVADIIAGFDSVSYYGFLIFAFVLTLNRFLVFMFPKANNKLFSKNNIGWFITLVWILFFVVITVWNLNSYKTYNIEGFYLDYIPRHEYRNVTIIRFISSFQAHLSNYLPPIILIMYAIIFVELKFNIFSLIFNGDMSFAVKSHNRKEINLLIQSVILCVALELENLVWYIPGWFDLQGNVLTIAYIFLNWTMIFMTMIDAFVIFAFSTLAKQQLREIIWKRKPQRNVTVFHTRTGQRFNHTRNTSTF